MSDLTDIEPTRPSCGICTRPLEDDEPQVCHPCHIRTRGHLLDIVELYATLPDHLAVLTGIRYEPGPRSSAETPVVGGDALVLAAGGNGNNVTASRRGNRDHALDQWHTDTPSVVAELERWEDDWREHRRDPAAPRKATVTSTSDYLLGHMRWASVTHPGFAEFAEDIRRLRARMRVVTGDIQRPVRADASCFDCGGQLVQNWRDDGLNDLRECDDCGRSYTPVAYMLACRARLEQQRDTA